MPVSPELASLLNASAQNDIDQDVMKFAKDKGISIDEAKQVLGAPQAVPEAEGVGDLIPKNIQQQAAQQSAKEATQTSGQLFRNVAVPVAQTAATMALPALAPLGWAGRAAASIPGQMGLGGLLEYGLQKAGLAPKSGRQIAEQTAMPVAGKVIEGVKGTGRMIANLSGKGQKAGEQAIAKRMGVPIDPYERGVTRPSKAAYQAAEAGAPVGVTPARDAIQKALDAELKLGSQANKNTVEYLEGILDDFDRSINSMGGVEEANVMVAKAQRLGGKAEEAFARKEKTGAIPLKEAAAGMGQTVPGMAEAEKIFSREDVVNKVFDAVRQGGSGKIKALDKLMQEEGEKLGKIMSKKEFDDIKLIAARMQDMTRGEGIFARGHDAIIKSFLADPNGLTVFRHAFGPTMDRLSPQRLTGLMTFIRGYEAQKRRKD